MTGKEILFQILLLQVSVWQLLEAASPSPLPIKALEGSCVVIPCTFHNPEPRTNPEGLSIKWHCITGHREVYPDGNPSGGRVEFVGDLRSDNCSLQINNVRKEDAAEYYPWIKPRITEKYELHTVQVSDKPEELSLSVPGEMTEGTPVNITCSAVYTCPPKPPTLTWSITSVNTSMHYEDLHDGRWKAVSQVIYIPTSGDHNASLECKASYTEKINSSKTISLKIKFPPKNTRAVVRGAAPSKEGESVTLICSGDGNPTVSKYSWFESREGKVPLGHGQTITLQNISWESGPYQCTAKNEVGDGISAPLQLNITYAPKGIEVIGETSPVEGTSVILTCTFKSSNPGVTNYTWYRNGNPLHGTASKMQFNHVTSNFSGIYKCMVHNNLGNSSSSPVTVTVLYPPKGTHVNASLNNPKAGDTLILKCETTSSNPGVEGYSWYKDESHLQNQSEETLTIANLEPSHSGSYRCEARNAAGRSFSPNATLDIGVSGTPLDSKSFATLGGTTAFLLLLLLALFILLWISWKRKKEEKAQKTPTERIPEDIVYVSIDHSKQRRTQRRSVPSDDFVTYAAVKRNTENEQPGPISDVAYAQVKKTRRPPKKEDEVIYATDVKFTPRTPNGQESQSVADDFVEYAAVKR
ncbi:B-cell receptor CD22-like isoform X1 [Ambystoma mexicanum]|uniref:B-cell receptor CD22-like isoform X1 n=1 Tax=Ambystoma mexicanum TaxID=8296 RepID=UPI0037E7E58B